MKNSPESSSLVRSLLERATSSPEPDLSHVAERVSAIMDVARRRGRRQQRDLLTVTIPLAQRFIPLLGTAVLVLLIGAFSLHLAAPANARESTTDIETLILMGDSASAQEMILGTMDTSKDVDD